MAGLRAELEDQANAFRRRFADSPLRQHLHSSDAYLIEKVSAAAASFVPSGGGSPGSDRAVGGAATKTLIEKLEAIREGILARGYDEWTVHAVDDALYVVRSVQQLLEGERAMPAEAAALLANRALRPAFADVVAIVQEIDDAFESPEDGWGNAQPST